MSGFPIDIEFHHKNYYAFGSCKEVGKNQSKNLVGALTDVIVNIYEFEDRGSRSSIFNPTGVNIVLPRKVFIMPNVGKKAFQVQHGSGILVSPDGSTTFLDGINFREDLVFVTHDEKIMSVKGFQKWNLEYGLKCLVWDSNGSNTETSFSALFPQFFEKANLHVKKAYESADEDDLLEQDEWPFIFNTDGSPILHSEFFSEQSLDILPELLYKDVKELGYKDVKKNPLYALLNDREQIWRLKSEVCNKISSPPGLWKIQGLEAQGYIRNLGAYWKDQSEHYNLESEVRSILALLFSNSPTNNPNALSLGPLTCPEQRLIHDKTEPIQGD